MGSFSDYAEGKVLDYVFSGAAFTSPATLYMALFSVTPSDSGGGTEASGGSYARKSITNNATNFPAASGTSPTAKTNGTAITMVTATADWSSGVNMVAWGLFDASTSGNLIVWGALDNPKPVLNGDTMSFAVSALSITLD